jgi:hypothetical protein
MGTDDATDIPLDAMLENCIFYISRMYEFSHSLDPLQTSEPHSNGLPRRPQRSRNVLSFRFFHLEVAGTGPFPSSPVMVVLFEFWGGPFWLMARTLRKHP